MVRIYSSHQLVKHRVSIIVTKAVYAILSFLFIVLGAVMAMHDAMALANLIYALPSNTSKSIQQAFAEYKAERMPHVMDSYKSCKVLAKSSETDLGGNMALFFSKNIPQFVWNVLWKSMVKNRPLAGFLPSIPSKGTIPSVVSASEQKARTIFEWRGTNVYAL
jgi:hypothetical protein